MMDKLMRWARQAQQAGQPSGQRAQARPPVGTAKRPWCGPADAAADAACPSCIIVSAPCTALSGRRTERQACRMLLLAPKHHVGDSGDSARQAAYKGQRYQRI